MQNKDSQQSNVKSQSNPKTSTTFYNKSIADRSEKTVTSTVWPKIKEGQPKEQRAPNNQNTPQRSDPTENDLDLDHSLVNKT